MKHIGKALGRLIYLGLFAATIYMEWVYFTSPGPRAAKHHGGFYAGAAIVILPLVAITLIALVHGRSRKESASTTTATPRAYSRTSW